MTLRLKMRSAFPASVKATNPITVSKTGGAYTFAFDPTYAPVGPQGATGPTGPTGATGVAGFPGVVTSGYGASGSALTTTGTISATSTSLALASALDFKNNQGILIFGAGPATVVGAPTITAVAPANTTGATTYAYKIASLDNQGALTAATAATTIANGLATLGAYQAGILGTAMNQITWTLGSGSPLATVIWRSTSGGAYVLLGAFTGTSIFDPGLPTQTILGIPATPPASPTNGWLATTITAGGTTTTLTLAAAAVNAVAAAVVQHDDTAAINAATAAETAITFPAGTYNVRGPTIPSTVRSIIGAGNGASIIKSFAATSGSAGVATAAMGGNSFFMTGMKIVAAVPMAFGGFFLNSGTNSLITENTFIGATGLRVFSSTKAIISNNTIAGWWDIGIHSDGSTDNLIDSNMVGAISGLCGAIGFENTTTPAGSGYVWGSGILAIGGSGTAISSNTVIPLGGNWGISCQEPFNVVEGNTVKYTSGEAIVAGGTLGSNFKVHGNFCYWSAAGSLSQSSYNFGSSFSDDGVHVISQGDISGNTYINAGLSSIAVFGVGASYTHVNITGNTIIGSNQQTDHPTGIELSGSNVSNVVVGPNTFLSPNANMTYQVGEVNSGFGTPNSNTIDKQLGVSGSSGTVLIAGAGSVYLGDFIQTSTVTVANLPAASAANKGQGRMVSNANATTFWTIVAGGGANIIRVTSDGTNWRIG